MTADAAAPAVTIGQTRLPDPRVAGFALAAGLWCLAILVGLVPGPSDTVGWWSAPLPNPYIVSDYSLLHGWWFTPAMAFPFYPLTLLPFPVFAALWTAAVFTAIYICVGRWAFLALLFPPVWWEVSAGNISLFFGVAVIAGFRWPAAWAFVLLTKVTPGIGLLWFAVRREWRSLAIALTATMAVVAVTFVLVPGLWLRWAELMISNAGNNGPGFFVVPLSLPIRLALAATIVTWGARTNRRWTVVVAAILGTPVLWFNALAGLIAIVAVSRLEPAHSRRLTDDERLAEPRSPAG